MEETDETKFRNRLKEGNFQDVQAKQLLDWGFGLQCICGQSYGSWVEFEQHMKDSVEYCDKLENPK